MAERHNFAKFDGTVGLRALGQPQVHLLEQAAHVAGVAGLTAGVDAGWGPYRSRTSSSAPRPCEAAMEVQIVSNSSTL